MCVCVCTFSVDVIINDLSVMKHVGVKNENLHQLVYLFIPLWNIFMAFCGFTSVIKTKKREGFNFSNYLQDF